MTEDLKGLIEKIQQEGVRAAQDKAKSIEQEAQLRAQGIIEEATKKSQKLIDEAGEQIRSLQANADISLEQAARDLLISLRKEINNILDKIVILEVHKALDSRELAVIIATLIKNYALTEDKSDITISLNKNDLEVLKKGLLVELANTIKNKIVLRSSDDIQGGFVISYDSGKSHYDFTDKALAAHISRYLEPHLAEILKKSALENK